MAIRQKTQESAEPQSKLSLMSFMAGSPPWAVPAVSVGTPPATTAFAKAHFDAHGEQRYISPIHLRTPWPPLPVPPYGWSSYCISITPRCERDRRARLPHRRKASRYRSPNAGNEEGALAVSTGSACSLSCRPTPAPPWRRESRKRTRRVRAECRVDHRSNEKGFRSKDSDGRAGGAASSMAAATRQDRAWPLTSR